jgi:hypothetical protein
MPSCARGALAALAVAFTAAVAVPAVIAQTQPPAQADQDHKAHHPDGKAPGTQAAPQTPNVPPAPSDAMGGNKMGQGGMMCGDMKQMMSMMQDMSTMMSAHSGMMASQADARIASLKTELKITDAQMLQWNRFAEALRGLGKSMEGVQEQTMPPAAAATLPARLARREARLSAHLAAVKALKEALDPLYASFSDEQKKIADTIRIGPMGMM